MNRQKWHSILFFGLVLLLAISTASCSQPPTASESPPPLPEPAESEEPPLYISSLAWELEAKILRGDLAAFLEKYPTVRFQLEDEKIWVHEFHFGRGGNYYMLSRIPAYNVYQAKVHIENASSLLTKGKLSTEIESRPLDKNEVAKELEEAQSLLTEQRSSSFTWEEENLEWAKQPRGSDISNEATIADIIETYDDYRQRLSEIISKLDRILSELPKALED